MQVFRNIPRVLASLLAVSLAGCANLRDTTTDQVDGRSIEYVLVRHDTPPVVFENGLGASLDTWAYVLPDIARDATAFAYNRPGYGRSEPVSTPRDGMHIVDELRALLRGKGLTPPYILVGHSLGGLYMQFFARRYPDEVAALILVDSSHPMQFRGKGSLENWPAWARLIFGVASTPAQKEELNAVNATGDAILALPPPSGKPVIVLSAQQGMDARSEFAEDIAEKRLDIARLYPGSKQVWVDSGHGIPLENPDAVVAAIRAVLPRKR
jgi:pimeloyl-ACP methyl ester carboxylesterase